MRQLSALLILLAIVLPAISNGEVLYLKDGSTLKGTLVRVVDDVFVFRSSFGAEFEIDRGKIAKIVFSDSIEALTAPGAALPKPVAVAAGSLLVVLEKVKLSSKINVERGRDKDALLAANGIKQSLLVSGVEVASYVDESVEKEIRDGANTQYRNDLDTQRMKIPLPPGQYQCEVVIRNVGLDDYKDRFDGRPVDHSVIVSNVSIQPATTTVIRIGHKGKRMGLGKGSLVLLQ